jgi:anti-anti-sigma factor
MEIKTEAREGYTLVVLTGESRGRKASGEFREACNKLLQSSQTARLVVDMGEVPFVDLHFLSELDIAVDACRRRGGDLRICKSQPYIKCILQKRSGLDIKQFNTEEEAAFCR